MTKAIDNRGSILEGSVVIMSFSGDQDCVCKIVDASYIQSSLRFKVHRMLDSSEQESSWIHAKDMKIKQVITSPGLRIW
jgi:hypothetical protein